MKYTIVQGREAKGSISVNFTMTKEPVPSTCNCRYRKQSIPAGASLEGLAHFWLHLNEDHSNNTAAREVKKM